MRRGDILLFLFASLLCVCLGLSRSFAQVHRAVVNVRTTGATGLKGDNATAAFAAAVQQLSASGGGVLYVPAGEYITGTIEFTDNMTLRLDAGATLIASGDSLDYPRRVTAVAGRPVLLFACKKKEISVAGSGTVKGNPVYGTRPVVPYDFIEKEFAIAKEAGLPLIMPDRKPPHMSLLCFMESRKVTLDGITILDSPFWSAHLQWCDDVTVTGITIRSSLAKGVNADGLDIDGCTNVRVAKCSISTGDDAIVLKSTRHNGMARRCYRVVVRDCRLESTSCALKIGTETHADISHVRFSDCIITNTNRGLGIFVRDGARVRDVVFRNIRMECNRKDFYWWGDGEMARFVVIPRRAGQPGGSISNLRLFRVDADVQGTSFIGSADSAAIRNVRLSHVKIRQSAEGTKDLRATSILHLQRVTAAKIKRCTFDRDSLHPGKTWTHSVVLESATDVTIVRTTIDHSGEGFSPLEHRRSKGIRTKRNTIRRGVAARL